MNVTLLKNNRCTYVMVVPVDFRPIHHANPKRFVYVHTTERRDQVVAARLADGFTVIPNI